MMKEEEINRLIQGVKRLEARAAVVSRDEDSEQLLRIEKEIAWAKKIIQELSNEVKADQKVTDVSEDKVVTPKQVQNQSNKKEIECLNRVVTITELEHESKYYSINTKKVHSTTKNILHHSLSNLIEINTNRHSSKAKPSGKHSTRSLSQLSLTKRPSGSQPKLQIPSPRPLPTASSNILSPLFRPAAPLSLQANKMDLLAGPIPSPLGWKLKYPSKRSKLNEVAGIDKLAARCWLSEAQVVAKIWGKKGINAYSKTAFVPNDPNPKELRHRGVKNFGYREYFLLMFPPPTNSYYLCDRGGKGDAYRVLEEISTPNTKFIIKLATSTQDLLNSTKKKPTTPLTYRPPKPSTSQERRSVSRGLSADKSSPTSPTLYPFSLVSMDPSQVYSLVAPSIQAIQMMVSIFG